MIELSQPLDRGYMPEGIRRSQETSMNTEMLSQCSLEPRRSSGGAAANIDASSGVHGSSEISIKLRAQGLCKTYGLESRHEVHALGPLDLEVQNGAFVSIIGPSGCGKSTFLRVAAGLTAPTRGTLEIAGADPNRAMSMVFQDYGIYPWKTVESNVRFGLQVAGVSKRESVRRAREWLMRTGMIDYADRYPDALSGGMRQRVAIARALAVEPEILLMDEPFAALDAQLRQILQDELMSICASDRRTVLFVTHSLEEAIVLADSVVVMTARPGRILRAVDVPFGRPRGDAVRSSHEFNDLKSELWELLRGEVEIHLAQMREGTE